MPRRTPGTDNRVLRVCRLLNKHRARYLLAGGVAANLHGSVRATKDVDILVPHDEANMARVLAALTELPYGIACELDAAEVARNPITIVGDDPRVDVLTVAWTVTFEQAWNRRLVRRILGTRVPYLGLDDLIASKQTGRASDRADVEQLRARPVNVSSRRARNRRSR
ncbi:MAG: nucleotidyltransferase domain-containing protein [Vicinamibacterales bacterium]